MSGDMQTPDITPGKRILSLDALRGFIMFWILGGDEWIYALKEANQSDIIAFIASQLEHRSWEGLTFYDLIFPSFVFIVGVSLVFSLSKRIAFSGKALAVRKVLLRSTVMYLLGIFYYGGLSGRLDDIRLLGVLQRIALCYLGAGLIFIFLKTRGRVIVCAVLLVGYWALMTFVPVPGAGAGNFAEGKNLANYVDSQYLPFFKWDGDHDPEGLLSTLPAVATCLLGVFAGQLLASEEIPAQKKVLWLAGAGAVMIIAGYLWGLTFPIVKKIWTSSYVLAAGGYTSLMLASFFQVIEIWKIKRWALPWVWIGMNPITLYLLHNIIDFRWTAERLAGGVVQAQFRVYGEFWIASVVVVLTLLLAYFLQRKQIYLRL
jgi:predicted acyltransferase